MSNYALTMVQLATLAQWSRQIRMAQESGFSESLESLGNLAIALEQFSFPNLGDRAPTTMLPGEFFDFLGAYLPKLVMANMSALSRMPAQLSKLAKSIEDITAKVSQAKADA